MPVDIIELLKGGNKPIQRSTHSQSKLNSQYDKGFLPVYGNEIKTLDNIRAKRQTNWDSFGNLLVRGIGKAALTVPETIGYLADVPEMLGLTDEYDNEVSELVREQKSWLDDRFPEYSRQITDGSFKPLDSEWWFRNGDSVIESLGYFVPGFAVGKGASAVLKGLKLSGNIQKFGSVTAAALALNYAESMQGAGEFYRQATIDYQKEGKSEEEARELAADGASSIIWKGKINTIFELPAMMSLFKAFGKINTINTRALKGVSGITSPGKRALKEFGKQVGSEYAEEVGMGFIQSEAEREKDKNLGRDIEEGNTLSRLIKYASSDQGLTEGLLGALGGGLFGALSTAKQLDDFKNQQQVIKELTGKNNEVIEEITTAFTDFNKKESEAIKLNNINEFEIIQEQKLNVLATINAYAGTFDQFLNDLELAAESQEGDNRDLLTTYKKQAKYVEQIVNKVESAYGDRSIDLRKKITDNLINQKVYRNKASEMDISTTEIYSENQIDNASLNLLYNKKTILEKSINKTTNEDTKKYLISELNKVKEEITVVIPPNDINENSINQYSDAFIDSLVQPYLANQYKYEFEATKENEELKEILDDQDKAEENIEVIKKNKVREDIESDIAVLKNKTLTDDSDTSAVTMESFEQFKTNMKETGYTDEEIIKLENDLNTNIETKERNDNKSIKEQVTEEQVTEANGDPLADYIPDEEVNEQIEEFAEKIVKGESLTTTEEQQFYDNNSEEIEKALLEKVKVDKTFDNFNVNPEPGLASSSREFETVEGTVAFSNIGLPIRTTQNEEFDFAYLNSSELNVGSVIELYVDKDSPYMKEGLGNTPETLHIKIRSEGKEVGNLKNFRTTGNSLDDSKTLDIRKQLFENQDLVIQTTVSEKTYGFFLQSKIIIDNQLSPARNSIKRLFREGPSILSIPTNKTAGAILYNNKSYGNGTIGKVYALIPAANGKLVHKQVYARKFNDSQSDIMADWIIKNFEPKTTTIDKLKENQNIIIEGVPFVVDKVTKENIRVYNRKTQSTTTFPLDIPIFENSYLNNKSKLEDYINFGAGKKINITQDRIIINNDSYSFNEIGTKGLSLLLKDLYFDVSEKTLVAEKPFTDLEGKEHSTYTDYIVDNVFYTTDLDINRPFYGAAIYLNYPEEKTIEKVENTTSEIQEGKDTVKAVDDANEEDLFGDDTPIRFATFNIKNKKRLLEKEYREKVKLSLLNRKAILDNEPNNTSNKELEYINGKLQFIEDFEQIDLLDNLESTEDILKYSMSRTNNKSAFKIAENILDNFAKNDDLKVIIEKDSFTNFYYYNPETNSIILPSNYKMAFLSGNIYNIIIHEFIHAYTLRAFQNYYSHPERITPQEEKFVSTIKELYEYSSKFISKDHYGMTNMEEFVSELTNPSFQKELKSISRNSRNIWNRILDAILKLFGIQRNNKDSIYNEAFNELDIYIKSSKSLKPAKEKIKRFARIPGFKHTEKKRRLDSINYLFIKASMNLIKKGSYSLEHLTREDVNFIYDAIKKQFEKADDASSQKVVDNWINFVIESKRSLVDFGFLYTDEDSFNILEPDNTTKESWQIKAFENNVKDSLSRQIKIYLKFIERIDKDGNYINDDLGRKTFIPYNEISTFLFKNLADLDTHQQMTDRLLKLSDVRPEFKRIYIDLTTDATSENFKNNFFTNFTKTKNNFITTLDDGKESSKVVRFIDSSRKNLKNDILNEWRSRYEQTTLVNDKVNKDLVDTAYTKFKSLKKLTEITEDDAMIISESLNDIGINIPIDRFIGLKGLDIRRYINGPSSINTLFQTLNKGYDIFNISEVKNSKGENTTLNKLAELDANMRPDDISPSVLTVDNNRAYAIQENTAVSKELRNLKEGKLDQFLSDPFYSTNININWGIERLQKDPEFREKLNFAVFNGTRRNESGIKGVSYENINPALWLQTKINGVLNQGRQYGWMPFPTPADKSNIYFAQLPITEIVKNGNSLNDVGLDMYYRIVLSETARIFKAKEELLTWEDKDLIIGYHFDININSKTAKKKAQNGNFSGKAFEYHIFKKLNDMGYNKKALVTMEFGSLERTEINKVINNYFDKRTKEVKDKLIETNIIKEENDILTNVQIDSAIVNKYGRIQNIIDNYTFNIQMGYWFIDSILLGDPAFTKNVDDYTKRIALWQTPGTDIGKGQYNLVIVKDDIEISKFATSYEKALLDIGISKDKITDAIGKNSENPNERTGYYDINRTDAQGFATWERYLDIMNRQGTITPELTANLEKITLGLITPEEAGLLFTPVKGTNIGHRIINGKRVPVAVKYSLVPLLPSFSKYPKLGKLLTDMKENGVDELVFESGFKLGTQELGNNKHPRTWNIIKLNNESYRIPQVVPYKDTDKTLLPTQSMKNLISNIVKEGIYKIGTDKLSGDEVIIEYQELIISNIITDYNTLVDRLRLNENDEETVKRLQTVLLSEGRKRNNMTINQEESLDIIDGNFRIPLSFPLWSNSRQNMFFSLFKKKVSTRKVSGFSAVNVSDFATTYDDGRDLKFYTTNYTDPVDSQKYTIEAAEIAVSQDYFRNVINSKYPDFNIEGDLVLDKIPEDLRYMIANRIPNQGKNSMIMCKIVSFLPKEAASQIMLPKEGTRQGGYDFDIDKSFILTKNFKIDNGIIRTIKYYSNPADVDIRYASRIERNLKASQIKEIFREFHEDISYNEDVIFKLNNALEDKVNNILNINRDLITDEEYYDIILDYYQMEDISKEEFSKMSIIGQNTLEARENRIIDHYIGILSSSHNFYESILPNNVDSLVAIRKEIQSILNIREEGKDIINPTWQDTSRELNQAGKQLIGVHSNSSVVRSYLQILNYISPYNALFDGKVLIKMHDKYDYKGNLVTNNHLELQNAAVDNAKEPILGDLNDNIYTAEVWDWLTDLSIPLETIGYFMKQPILIDLVNKWNNGGRTNIAGETAMSDLFKLFPKSIITTGNIKNLILKDLKEQLSKTTPQYQYEVLKAFQKYKEASGKHTRFIASMRADSVRTKPTVVGNQIYMDNYDNHISPEIENKLPMMATFTKYGIAKPLSLSSEYFIWNAPIFNEIRKLYTSTQSDFINTDVIEALNYDLFSYIYLQEGSPLSYSYDNLQGYLFGDSKNDSLNNRVIKLQKEERVEFEKDSLYIMNPFIMSLSEREQDGYSIPVLDTTSGNRSKEQKDDIIDSWHELFDSDEHSELAWDLALYSFFINGFNKGIYSFMDYVPIQMLEDMGVMIYWNKIESIIKAGGDLNIDHNDFIEKFARNLKNRNLGVTKRIRKDGNKLLNGVMINDTTIEVGLDFTISHSDITNWVQIISMNEKGKTRYFKFHKADGQSAQYVEVNALGNNIIKEYFPNSQIKSIFEENNVVSESVISEDNQAQEKVSIIPDPLENYLPEDEIEIYKWSRFSNNSYEVSSQGDKRFSALYAKLKDGRTIEEAYQLDIKGYRIKGDNWKLGKGKRPLRNITKEQQWNEYKDLWKKYLIENSNLLEELKEKTKGKILTDKFATTNVSQARALSEILNEDNLKNQKLNIVSMKQTQLNLFNITDEEAEQRRKECE